MDHKRKQDEHSDLFAGFSTAYKSFATEAIHVGQEPEQWKSMAVVPPISLSTTFKQLAPGNHAVSSPYAERLGCLNKELAHGGLNRTRRCPKL